jgi:hypothetical protein
LTFLFTHWNTSVQAAVTCKRAYSLAAATQVQVIPDKFHGASEIVPIYKKLLVRDETTLYQPQPTSNSSSSSCGILTSSCPSPDSALALSSLPLPTQRAPNGNEDTLEIGFEFRKQRYVYDPTTNTFHRLKFPIHETFDHYLHASGYGSAEKVLAAVDTWGLNQFEVPVPEFLTLLKEQMLAPFFVFQVFCVGLWCLDEYW